MDFVNETNESTYLEQLDESSSNSANKKMKHFKKSMIVEYEKIESNGPNEESQSGSSSNSSTDSVPTITSFANASISIFKRHHSESSNVAKDEKRISNLELSEQCSTRKSLKKTKLKHLIDQYACSDNSENSTESNSTKNVSSSKKAKISQTVPKNHQTDKSSKSSKEKSSSKRKTYCICKSSDSRRFMIACDNCDDWFHGDCVGISQSLSKKIKTFYCHLCRSAKPLLKIKYKTKFQEFFTTLKNKDALTNLTDTSLLKFYKETQNRNKKESELLKKTTSGCSNSATTPDNELNDLKKVECKSDLNSLFDSSESSSSKLYGKTNIPGEDIQNFLLAMTKIGTEAAQQLSQNSVQNESSSVINNQKGATSASSFAGDHDYTTSFLKEEQPNCKHLASSDEQTSSSSCSSSETSASEDSDDDDNSGMCSDNDTDGSNQTISDSSVSENSKDQYFTSSNRKTHSSSKENNIKQRQFTSEKHTTDKKNSKSFKKANTTNRSRSMFKKQVTLSKFSTIRTKQQPQQQMKPIRRYNRNLSSNLIEADVKKVEKEQFQCFGPECTKEAVANSKYCSFECGMKLAKSRLVNFLKLRNDSYNQTPCFSNQLNLNELERIDSEMNELKAKLNELEQKHVDLDNLIERAKYEKINPDVEKDRDKYLDSNETEIYCVTCGHICSERHALKHMEKCFNKIESQAFFGSFYKSYIEGKSMFCDNYNPQTKMYCKRLKVMCPEHEKEKKINEDEVCGYPLHKLNNICEDSIDEICLASKRNCSIHFKWEKLRRAQIDLEKLRTWLKLEELIEQKKMNETSLSNRGGLLSILLHQTDTDFESISHAFSENKLDSS